MHDSFGSSELSVITRRWVPVFGVGVTQFTSRRPGS
jgi:hypothetical protein